MNASGVVREVTCEAVMDVCLKGKKAALEDVLLPDGFFSEVCIGYVRLTGIINNTADRPVVIRSGLAWRG